jgi:hypothetical protein
MGQYHIPVNLDKKQTVNPHKLATGLKLWEQLANNPGTGAALVVLLASASNGDGGGDLQTGNPVIGSWRGDRIAFVGDYDDNSRYEVDGATMTGAEIYEAGWFDVSHAVCAVIEYELSGKFTGDGWRDFTRNE